MVTDPYTGTIIPDGVPMVRCPNGHINRAESWAIGNRCHYSGCNYVGAPIAISIEEITDAESGQSESQLEEVAPPAGWLPTVPFKRLNRVPVKIDIAKMPTYTDPLTGAVIPPGTSIVKCRHGHINRADSWTEGNRCHHPGCNHRGSPASAAVMPEDVEEITVISTSAAVEDPANQPGVLAPSEGSTLNQSTPLDIQVLRQSSEPIPWWPTFWPTLLFATFTCLVFGLTLVAFRYAELVAAGITSDIISSYLLNDIARWTVTGLWTSLISAMLLTLLRITWLRR